ncbi:MAG: GFA family protein, partial [Myxococcales bacterium]|nr:GFA family protein [Myxococcales bacterium]
MTRTWTLPMTGGCRCDRVRFEVSLDPILTSACHCTGCQKMSSSAYSLTVMVPTDGFAVVQGDVVQGGLHGEDARHMFCDHCKTWMFTRIDAFGLVNVRATLLDDPSWFEPFIETYTCEKLAWATTPAQISFEKFPPPESYGALMDAFRTAHQGGHE